MPSQSINTEISTLSKTFALLLIEDHEIINSLSGIDTEGVGRVERYYGFCHRSHAVMILFLF